jgi:hypothetical protein
VKESSVLVTNTVKASFISRFTIVISIVPSISGCEQSSILISRCRDLDAEVEEGEKNREGAKNSLSELDSLAL